ncbi:MAG: Lrp/AsnC family transcriptional regulator [Candidatus Eremiobacteraeota bacterium]|nr:Lrp/AsnC family transcriptional regulator [Candidatus Eremiobacteraeota bacterium]
MVRDTEKIGAIDDIDRDILGALQRDGRQSFSDLAAGVGLSANAVADRVRRLLQSKAIVAIEARIDPELLDQRFFAFIDVKLRPDTSAERFEREITLIPQILSATLTTGSFDYTLRAGCSDQSDLVAVVERLRARAGVAETYSRLILREQIFRRSPSPKQSRSRGRFGPQAS